MGRKAASAFHLPTAKKSAPGINQRRLSIQVLAAQHQQSNQTDLRNPTQISARSLVYRHR